MTDLTELIAALDDEIAYLRDDGDGDGDALEHAVASSLSRIRESLAGLA